MKYFEMPAFPSDYSDKAPTDFVSPLSAQTASAAEPVDQRPAEIANENPRLLDIFMQAPAFMAVLRGAQHVFEMANTPYYQLVGHRDILGKSVAEALPEVVEQGFLSLLDSVFQTGKPFLGRDVRIFLQAEPRGPLSECFVDFIYQPLFEQYGTISGIFVHGVDLTERKRLEQERERLLHEKEQLLTEARDQTKREALLQQIATAMRTTETPEAILQTTVSLLGQGLNADRCYFVRYDQTRDAARIFPEWFRADADIQPLAGRTFQPSSYSVGRNSDFKAGNTHVVNDVVAYDPQEAAPVIALNVRALLRVPLDAGNHMTSLTVAMAYQARQWTEQEVRLVESVATLLRSVLEAAQHQQRERNIAKQLQAALQPPPPAHLPFFPLASYYRPALAEANVGGDFFDVFPVETGCTALVVADLSGKGLAAAAQVATVRNMLRLALYTGNTIREAITILHNTLVEHHLLSGFATLFVGMYDENERTLTYVNCGQEPGLLWRRATQEVEALVPTGPVLGGFASGGFEQRVVSLSSGDTLALFSDGLTEVGPSRKEQLQIEGVSQLLREHCTDPLQKHDPQAVVDCLIAGVDRFARGGARDDVALLVGVVT